MDREARSETQGSRKAWTDLLLCIPRLAAALGTKVNFQLLDQDAFPKKFGGSAQDADSDETRLIPHILVYAVFAGGRTRLQWSGVVPAARTTSHGYTTHTTTRLASANGWSDPTGRRAAVPEVILVIRVFLPALSRRQADAQYHDTTIHETPTTYRTPAQPHQQQLHQQHHQQRTSIVQHAGLVNQTLTQDTR